MDNVNFIVSTTGYLRYFIPIVTELNKRNIKSLFFLFKIPKKYCCPYHNLKSVQDLSKKYGFEIKNISEINKHPSSITFLVEGNGVEHIKYDSIKISFTCQTDFRFSYHQYIKKIDYVYFLNESYAKFYKTISPKNLYLGLPKYDIDFNEDEIRAKYKLPVNKKALVLFPRVRDLHKINMKKIYKYLDDLGYIVILKARGKEPVPDHLKVKYYFEDEGWYPHPTMEFIYVSDFIVNFDSTAIEECVMMNKPLINFNIKPHDVVPLAFLYEYNYCKQLRPSCSFNDFKESVDFLMGTDLNEEFRNAKGDYLSNGNKVVKNILDRFLGNDGN